MMKADLTQKKCEPCEGKTLPFTEQEAKEHLKDVPGWELDAGAKGIHRTYIAQNFLTAVVFINKVAEVAEKDNHHPDIHLTRYKKLRVELSTHAIGGLSENDFIVAAKINKLNLGE